MSVSALSYIAFDVSDAAAWRDLMQSVFGAQLIAREDGSAIDVRIDGRHHRITLYPGDTDGLSAIGWELADRAALDTLADKLETQGIAVSRENPGLAAERYMAHVYTFVEPHIGIATEIACGPTVTDADFLPSRPISDFNVGPDLGLGHAVFWTADLDKTVAFYRDTMGFSISDTMAWDDNEGVFLHCNKRHHTLAVMAAAPGRPAGALGHIMLESTSQDDVGSGYDIVRDKGIPLALEMGKHTNDLMQSFYLQTPSGFWMEYGFGGRLIEGEWTPEHYDAPMIWGHRPAG